ncbi:MAG: nucleotidyltransferase domain-containing protein [Solirubrobacterales bacterium]
MDPKISRLLERVKAFLHERYGESIKRVILYGSYARGEATKDSDVDVLVVVDPSLNPSEVRKSLSDLLFDIVLEEGELVSVVAVQENRYQEYDSPFMLNVKREGVTV